MAWVIYGALEQVTGGYIYDRLVVERLRDGGDEVTVLSLEPGTVELPRLTKHDFDVVVGDELCFRELTALFGAPDAPRRVLLIHHLTAWELPAGVERERTLDLERAAILAADVHVATSHVTAARLRDEGLLRQVLVAEPGADRLPRPVTAGLEPSGARLRVLFVGNLLRRKRVLPLVQAFGRLLSLAVELVLVGAELEPDYARELRRAVAESGTADRVRFLGSLPAERVAEELSLADVLVLPSALEGYGMVLSEALWAGVPVIAARVGAAEQLVGETDAGLLFDADDEAGLATALSTFVADPSLRARLRHAAWRAAEVLPSWRGTALALRAAFT